MVVAWLSVLNNIACCVSVPASCLFSPARVPVYNLTGNPPSANDHEARDKEMAAAKFFEWYWAGSFVVGLIGLGILLCRYPHLSLSD